MLIKPELEDKQIINCLHHDYGVHVDGVEFLALGADLDTAVYRIKTPCETDYFLKLRRKAFNQASVMLPNYLANIGIKQVISPIETKRAQLWTHLASYRATLYPFVDAENTNNRHLTDKLWLEFGATMKKIHRTNIPEQMACYIPHETFSKKWRLIVNKFLTVIAQEVFEDPIAKELADVLQLKSKEIFSLLKHCANLARILDKEPPQYVLCHADIHGWSVLISKNNQLYIIDWDTLIFAPKERDLMFIGAGIGDTGRTQIEEEALFYAGYGTTEINYVAIAYYRFERIIQDIAEYSEHIFLSNQNDEERSQSLEYLKANFLPDGALERAWQSYHQIPIYKSF